MPDPKLIPKGFRPVPFDYHEEIELEIDTLTNMGKGLARTQGGWVVFVPFCLPGERVLARIYRNDKNFSEADLVKVITQSPERINPHCELFGQCGGCQYQNLNYSSQLAWKRRQLKELIQHMAGVSFPVAPVIPSPLEYGYRSKITPHFDKPRNNNINAIGFQQAGRRKLIDVPQCAIAHPAINLKLTGARDSIRKASREYKKGATLLFRADDNGNVHTKSADIAVDRVDGIEFQYLAGSFFQNNPSILPEFTSHVKKQASSAGATHMVDAYCGAGLFALTAASQFKETVGIEVSEESVLWAKKNAEINFIKNVRFITGKVEEFFNEISFPGEETAVVIDPPRKGCSNDFLSQLFKFSARTVIYVSCNPATQLRDLLLFQKAGYALEEVQPFDLFPQTKHLECVMTLNNQTTTHHVT
ncbi:MAG: class I SAM-dependent RNA methyltransferase [Verrucomicrobiaceae bacterium]|nr:class I SAM-dependent RNA methyltransferase [Verrucomicrobiaceae bacterium]